jgi:NAD(P)-dependent dehydrogenase (short-subunit alcohol dehydrogenase family)
MDLQLSNSIAVITGGTSGIGLASAQILLKEGARVAICGRDSNKLAQAKAGLDHLSPGRVLARECDVLDADAVKSFADEIGEWSGGRVDLLVTNAGQGRVSTFDSTTNDEWREEFELKLFSQILPIRAFRHLLERSEAPAIVGVNSLLSLQPEPHMVCTSAARAGVQNLLKSLANEFAPRIRVNTILFGLVDSAQWQRRYDARTELSQSREEWFANLARQKHIPLGRLCKPDEAARAIVYLGSPAASYITGASLEVSGGLSRHI